MYKVEFEGLTGALKKISGIWELSFWVLFNVPAARNVWWNLSDWILDFCTKTSGLITGLVYLITESLSPTHSIHRNYYFSNPTPCSNPRWDGLRFIAFSSNTPSLLKLQIKNLPQSLCLKRSRIMSRISHIDESHVQEFQQMNNLSWNKV